MQDGLPQQQRQAGRQAGKAATKVASLYPISAAVKLQI